MKIARDCSYGYLISRLGKAMNQRLEAALAPHDVTPRQWSALATLWARDGIALSTLAGEIGADRPTVSGLIGRMEKKGLVRRVPDEEDGRSFRVFLTEAGWELKKVLPPLADRVNEEALGLLTSDERNLVMRALQKSLQGMVD